MTGTIPRPRPWTRRLRYGWVLEAALGVGTFLLFDEARARVAGSGVVALANARDLVDWERTLGLYQEYRIQHAFLDWHWFLSFWNFYYGTIHFVMPAVALVVLWRRAPQRYIVWRNTVLLMLTIGLVLFWAYPLMPPRLMPGHFGFVDTAAAFYNFGPQQRVVLVHGMPNAAAEAAFGNLFAAMPSFHAGWSMWSALALLPAVRNRLLRGLIVLDPILTTFAIVVTANHWILDAVGGWAVLAISWATVTLYERWRHPEIAAAATGAAARSVVHA
ncbi:MAG: phosphatase PAP2 family protein [Acidimicrobiia bacterium]